MKIKEYYAELNSAVASSYHLFRTVFKHDPNVCIKNMRELIHNAEVKGLFPGELRIALGASLEGFEGASRVPLKRTENRIRYSALCLFVKGKLDLSGYLELRKEIHQQALERVEGLEE